MGKRDKGKSAKFEVEENKSERLDSKHVLDLSSSDDEEANEDLSLKIVEKALLVKAAKSKERNDAVSDDRDVVSVVDLSSSSREEGGADVAGTSGVGEEADFDLKFNETFKRKKKKMKIEKVFITEDGDKAEMIEKAETVEEAELAKAAETVESVDPDAVDISDNVVLRKLLRGPRYFDPPDSSWQTCYKCGEEGHMAVNCKSASKRKKPCFICGSLDHGARQCSKAQDCFICKKSGHRAKDCPDKHKSGSKNVKFCLRCGDSGHEMFSCRKGYSDDDLKEIQCYICKSFGHLCCVNSVDSCAIEVSCYRCGQLGHTGLSCGKSRRETKETGKSRGETKETTGNLSPSLCFKCGEGGHFARECPIDSVSSGLCYKCGEGGHFARECIAKVGKRNHISSTSNVRPRKEKEVLGYNSAPHDHGRRPKRKKIQYEENGFCTPRKVKQRGGWITEDPGDYSHRKYKRNNWNSPSTPSNEGWKKSSLTYNSRISGSQSSKQKNSHRYSASRFGNFGNDEPSRMYDRW